VKRLWVMLAVGSVLTGCEGDKLQAAGKRLEAAQASQRELDVKTQALSSEVSWMEKRLQELEAAKKVEQGKLDQLEYELVQSWRGDPAALKERMEEAEVPKALQASLLKAQESSGDIAAERTFIEGVEKEDLTQIAEALESWELRTGVTDIPEEEEAAPEQDTCERVEAKFSCLPLPLGGPKDDVTQLCRLSQTDMVWVLRSEQGSLVRANLVGSSHDRYRPVRMFSPELWVLAGEDDSPTSPGTSNVSAKAWLEVFKLSGGSEHSRQAVRRHALPLEKRGQPVALVELDLDGDGAAELLLLDGKDIQAVRYEPRYDDANIWGEEEVCPLIEKRTEKELEPARASCTAWAQAKQPKDGGAP
jgi:hypothetical protein